MYNSFGFPSLKSSGTGTSGTPAAAGATNILGGYVPITSASTGGGGLAGDAARQNISAGGDIGTLSTLLQNINNLNNTNRVYGGQQMEQQSSQNISNELAGVLSNPIVANDQMLGAERGAGGGFGIDSANTNAAVLRAMNLQSEDLQKQGQADLTGAYNRAAPLVDASQFAVSPSLLQQQRDEATQRALQSQQQANSVEQWKAQLAEQTKEFGLTYDEQQAKIAQENAQYYADMAMKGYGPSGQKIPSAPVGSTAPMGYDAVGNLVPGGTHQPFNTF